MIMIEHWVTIKSTFALTGIAASSVMLGDIATQISGNTNISLSEAVAVTSVVLGGAWWLSSRLQKIDDRLESMERAQRHMADKCDSMSCPATRIGSTRSSGKSE